jgi:uncharacterized protein (DUF924 family)
MSKDAHDNDLREGSEGILSFWFGAVGEDGLSSEDSAARWWKKDPAFDELLRERFAHDHAAILRGERDEWLSSARGRLAFVIVLDQFSRNMFRDTAGMFAHDELALRAALEGIELRMDQAVRGDMRAFYYLPLMHSEDLDVQDRCVELFRALVNAVGDEQGARFENNLKYAIAHRDIVAKWGRFPHRNAVLGRESSAEELDFLQQPGSSF